MAKLTVSREVVDEIWAALNKPHRHGHEDIPNCHKNIISQEWAMNVDIQDLLWEMDERSESPFIKGHFKFLIDNYNLHMLSRFRGPFMGKDGVIGHEAMRIADVAVLVIEIERLGFSVSAESLVTALRPRLLKQKYATGSEVTVMWHQRLRHKSDPMILCVEGERATDAKAIQTHSGYKATALFDGDGPVGLRVDAKGARNKVNRVDFWLYQELASLEYEDRSNAMKKFGYKGF